MRCRPNSRAAAPQAPVVNGRYRSNRSGRPARAKWVGAAPGSRVATRLVKFELMCIRRYWSNVSCICATSAGYPTASCERSNSSPSVWAACERLPRNPRTPSRTRWRLKDPRLGVQPRRVLVVQIFTVAFGNAASLSIASASDAPMYIVVNTRSGRPRALQCTRFGAKLCELDERAQKVNRVRAIEFASQVLEQLVALAIRLKGMEQSARPLWRLCRASQTIGKMSRSVPLVIALEDACTSTAAPPAAPLVRGP